MPRPSSDSHASPSPGSNFVDPGAIHLRSVALRDPGRARSRDGFPFDIPLVQAFEPVRFEAPVTFLVGENAAGKSTFLEALAAAAGSIVVGGEDIGDDPSLGPARALAKEMRLVWNRRTGKGFFLRAEDFFNYVRRVNRMRGELEDIAEGFEEELSGYGLQLAKGAALGQKKALERRYAGDLDERSHGESFLSLFQARFQAGGLYLMDEPEAALSPTSQLGLISMLKQMSGQKAQFVIATHSPILLAFPGARILSFDEHPIREIDYEDAEHVRLYRDFLAAPERFLKLL